eukprot:5399569-Pyramimonas_sp.AAC.1
MSGALWMMRCGVRHLILALVKSATAHSACRGVLQNSRSPGNEAPRGFKSPGHQFHKDVQGFPKFPGTHGHPRGLSGSGIIWACRARP